MTWEKVKQKYCYANIKNAKQMAMRELEAWYKNNQKEEKE